MGLGGRWARFPALEWEAALGERAAAISRTTGRRLPEVARTRDPRLALSAILGCRGLRRVSRASHRGLRAPGAAGGRARPPTRAGRGRGAAQGSAGGEPPPPFVRRGPAGRARPVLTGSSRSGQRGFAAEPLCAGAPRPATPPSRRQGLDADDGWCGGRAAAGSRGCSFPVAFSCCPLASVGLCVIRSLKMITHTRNACTFTLCSRIVGRKRLPG